MKTKTIPFNKELAEKIQEGEIEGKIKYSECNGHTYDAEIIKFDVIADKSKAKPNSNLFRTIVAIIDFDDYQGVRTFNTDGYGVNPNNGDDTKLFLEVPEEAPEEQHPIEESELYQPGYKVGFEAGRCVAFDEKKGCVIKKEAPKYDDVEEVPTGDGSIVFLRHKKHEFKPFDKVLVRNIDTTWTPALFSQYCKIGFRLIGGEICTYCIPYEGNQELIGTTKTPLI